MNTNICGIVIEVNRAEFLNFVIWQHFCMKLHSVLIQYIILLQNIILGSFMSHVKTNNTTTDQLIVLFSFAFSMKSATQQQAMINGTI